ncbi:glycosyltransferase [Sedimentisphaera salicampi]|uniref:glycosyltransferase n=1 Tax=Sedimentisphaera salicampi TaxID=1941349 RepID=UPI000B9BFBF6|nr:glycosyltransferase [Sedimentisphaera salicampi]OXU15570.1 Spore coat protein SA [Sedimentisphaera salicampi]
MESSKREVVLVCGNHTNAHTVIGNLEKISFQGEVYIVRSHSDPVLLADRLNRKVKPWILPDQEVKDFPQTVANCWSDSKVYVIFTSERFHRSFIDWGLENSNKNIVFHIGDLERASVILDRYKFYKFIESKNMAPVPETILGDEGPFNVFGEEFIVRPRESFQNPMQKETVSLVKGRRHYNSVMEDYFSRGLGYRDICFQEKLNIKDEYNVSLAGWYDKTHQHISCMRKRYQHPPGVGTGDITEIIKPPENLLESTLKILNELNYKGPFELEFVFDSNKNEYKVIEMNPRFWMQHGLVEQITGFAIISRYLNREPQEINLENPPKFWVNTLHCIFRAMTLHITPLMYYFRKDSWAPYSIFQAFCYAPLHFITKIFKSCKNNNSQQGKLEKIEKRQHSVFQITSRHRIYDERIFYKTAECLSENNFRSNVLIPCKDDLFFNNVFIQASPLIENKYFARLFTPWFLFAKVLLNKDNKVVAIHDPDLLKIAFLLKILGKRVIYDIHDDYEASVLTRLSCFGKLFAKVCSKLWWFYEKSAVKFFDGVTVADRHLQEKFSWKNPVLLPNSPPLNFTNTADFSDDTVFRIIYVGGVTKARGIEAVLKALRLLDYENLCFDIIGNCRDERILELIQADKRVNYHGRVEWDKLHEFYEKSHLGVALYQNIPSFYYCPGENAVKIQEYMAAGLPVITSNFPGLITFVEENDIGFNVQPDSPEAIAEMIDYLYQNRSKAKEFGQNGRRAFESKYCWDIHKHKLIELYEKILAGRNG